MEWGAAIATLLGLILWGLKQWQANQPQREKEAEHEATQQGRADIAGGDADAVSLRIDSVPSPGGNPARLGDDEDTKRRLAEITGS